MIKEDKNIDSKIQTIEDIEKGLDKELEKYQYSTNNDETMEQARICLIKTINILTSGGDVTPQTAMIAIAEILQSGGHIRGVTARKVYYGDWDLTKKRLVSVLSTARCNCTLRAIARAHNKIIAKIAMQKRIYGNLYPQYKTYNPNIIQESEEIQLQHAIYCVDFQKDNKDAPLEVLQFLNQREIEKKNKNNRRKS